MVDPEEQYLKQEPGQASDQVKGLESSASDQGGRSTSSKNESRNLSQEGYKAHVASNISSSMSGNVVGNMVGDKRMNLLDALKDAEPQVGRRPTPEHDPWPKRKMYIRGIALCLLVCVFVVALVMVISQYADIGSAVS